MLGCVLLVVSEALSFATDQTSKIAAGARYPITEMQVRKALESDLPKDRHLQPGDAITVAPALSSVEIPRLQVFSIAVNEVRNAVEVRLQCRQRECLPFYAIIRPKDSILEWNAIARTSTTGRQAKRPRSRSPLIRAGQKTILLLTNPGMRISIPVVCLQSGAAGETIDVRAISFWRYYRAQVRADGTLAGG